MRFDKDGNPIQAHPPHRDPTTYILAVSLIGLCALVGVMWSTGEQRKYEPHSASPMSVVIVGGYPTSESPTDTPSPPLCEMFLPPGTICKFVPTPSPVGACPPPAVGYCIYDGPRSLMPPPTMTPAPSQLPEP